MHHKLWHIVICNEYIEYHNAIFLLIILHNYCTCKVSQLLNLSVFYTETKHNWQMQSVNPHICIRLYGISWLQYLDRPLAIVLLESHYKSDLVTYVLLILLSSHHERPVEHSTLPFRTVVPLKAVPRTMSKVFLIFINCYYQ